MMKFGFEFGGLNAEELERRASVLRPTMARAMRPVMLAARKLMVRAVSGSVLNVRSGRTQRAMRKARIKTWVATTGVVGQLGHRALVLNIHEGGAMIPAMTIRPKKGHGALVFQYGGKLIFAKKVTTRAHRLPARPITRPALQAMIPVARLKLGATFARVIEEGREAGGADHASE